MTCNLQLTVYWLSTSPN